MKPISNLLTLSLGPLLILSAPVMSQEADVRDAVHRTFAALNARQVDELVSQFMPRTQVFFRGGGGLRELEVEDWRALVDGGDEFDLSPRNIRIQIHGNVAVIAAYVHGTVTSPSRWVEGGPWRYSEVRVRDQGKWKIAQVHFSPLGHGGPLADRLFDPKIDNPAYPVGTGPLVLIDEAHFNQNTAWHAYWGFAELLRRDGYVVRESAAPFSLETLEPASVLVIANAMSQSVFDSQQATPLPAFTPHEVAAVRDWVNGGGSLLFIVDHNPYPGSVEELAKAFGIQFWNCGASYPGSRSGRLMFRRSEGVPEAPPITRGEDSVSYGSGGRVMGHPVTAGIDSVATFLGSAFRVDASHYPLLVFGPGVECWGETDLVVRPQGQMQGALLEFGNGRVAVFGDAGMFTAQLNALVGTKTGMNNPIAGQNPQLLRNVIHWLTRLGEQR